LSTINQQLWFLEDFIRVKSKKREFDQEYIICAENIHIMNDQRYNIKRQINTGAILIYIINKKEEVVLWKEFTFTIPISIEFNIDF
jgi:hypothetical protein